MDGIDKVKSILDEHHTKSGGSCGITIPNVHLLSKIPYPKINQILKQLYEEKYFKLRKGINGHLLFKKV